MPLALRFQRPGTIPSSLSLLLACALRCELSAFPTPTPAWMLPCFSTVKVADLALWNPRPQTLPSLNGLGDNVLSQL